MTLAKLNHVINFIVKCDNHIMPEDGKFRKSKRDGRDTMDEDNGHVFSLLRAVLPALRCPFDERVAFQHFPKVLTPSVLASGREVILRAIRKKKTSCGDTCPNPSLPTLSECLCRRCRTQKHSGFFYPHWEVTPANYSKWGCWHYRKKGEQNNSATPFFPRHRTTL